MEERSLNRFLSVCPAGQKLILKTNKPNKTTARLVSVTVTDFWIQSDWDRKDDLLWTHLYNTVSVNYSYF